MKKQVFNHYVDVISREFGVSKKLIFTKSKRRDIVDARHMLYYVCRKNDFEISYIVNYMVQGGYDITHSSIIHGIGIMSEKIDSNEQVKQLAESICTQ